MYKKIYVPLDNSDHSNGAMTLAVHLAKLFGARIIGSHVYAAKLHDVRFRQMEYTLPEEYQEEKELEKQRKIHDSLITMGLKLISDSYLDVMEKTCAEEKIPFERKMFDGKNYAAIVEDIRASDYDLVVIGALGTGAVKESLIGSVTERVVRRTQTDTLVVKESRPQVQTGPILVAIDGSPQSFAGLKTAMLLARAERCAVEAVAVYDPYLHYSVFNGIVDVLSEKASKIFRFKEQEQLHEEIIDTGLAKIYQSHLQVAKDLAREEGVELATTLLDGKAFEKVLNHARKQKARLLVVGRIGVHSDDKMDIGSNAENLLRLSPCNILLVSQRFVPPTDVKAAAAIAWTEEASKRFERVPEQVRGIARTAVHRFAMERGHSVITNSVIEQVMAIFMPGSAKVMSGVAVAVASEALAGSAATYICEVCGHIAREVRPQVCPVCDASSEKFQLLDKEMVKAVAEREGGMTETSAFDGVKIKWSKEAVRLVNSIKDGYQRRRAMARLEKTARVRALEVIPVDLVEEILGREREAVPSASISPPSYNDNEIPSPIAVPVKWEAHPLPTVTQGDGFSWSEEALARLRRVPAGFMRDGTRAKIEEYAKKKNVSEITLTVAEAGIEEAKKLMAEMITGYTQSAEARQKIQEGK